MALTVCPYNSSLRIMSRPHLLQLTLFVILQLVAFGANAQRENNAVCHPRTLEGAIVDYVTNFPLDHKTTILLLRPDSECVAKGYVVMLPNPATRKFEVAAPDTGRYILQFAHPDYHPLEEEIHVPYHRRERTVWVGRYRMRRKLLSENPHQLDEVEVRATKVKFYFDDDTLVYNADAFVTQQGFVLNDIIRKLPGVEVKDDGSITVGGRPVKALLLNGKDFFDRDRRTLLENLPAFMVKDVKVYDKERDSLSAIRRERDFSGYVMDIKLKRDYQTATVANADVGLGTDSRFYTKLFGMKFGPQMRVSLYGGANNVNKEEGLQTDGGVVPISQSQSGDAVTDKVGLAYNYDDVRGRYALSGGLGVRYHDNLSERRTYWQRFFQSGDTYGLSSSRQNDYDFKLNTQHDLYLLGNTALDFRLTPSLTIERTHSRGRSLSADYHTDVYSLFGDSVLRSLRQDGLDRVTSLYGINKSAQHDRADGNHLNARLGVSKEIPIPHTTDVLKLGASIAYDRTKKDAHRHEHIWYVDNAAGNSALNQLTRSLVKQWEASLTTGYKLDLSDHHALNLDYAFDWTKTDNGHALYVLHNLSEGSSLGGDLWALPSSQLLQDVLDLSNSYAYTKHSRRHKVGLSYSYATTVKGHVANLSVTVPFSFLHQSLDFLQSHNDTTIRRNLHRPNLQVNYTQQRFLPGMGGYLLSLAYNLEHQMPDLYNLVDFRDSSSPLYVVSGNPSLRDAVNHSLYGQFFLQTKRLDIHRINFSYVVARHAATTAVVYDKSTGIIHASPRNVEGNNVFDLGFSNTFPLPKSPTLKLVNELGLRWTNSASYINLTGGSELSKNTVHNFRIEENLGMKYNSTDTKLSLEGTAYLIYNRSTSAQAGFQRINAFDFGLRGNASVELPRNVRLTTGLFTVSRLGYNLSAMNTDEFIWNASLAKSFGEHIIVSLEGFDLLNQLKSTLYYVDAQARTETFTNNLRRYAMLHFVYRFNASPKR